MAASSVEGPPLIALERRRKQIGTIVSDDVKKEAQHAHQNAEQAVA